MKSYSDRSWDAIIIGAGMSGSALAYVFSKANMKVLIIEAGPSHLASPPFSEETTKESTGEFAETLLRRHGDLGGDISELVPFLRATGRETRSLNMRDKKSGQDSSFLPFMGSGTGGSSIIYGGVLSRYFPDDFKKWPITYDEMRPYYKEAERLLSAHGELDPNRIDSLDPLPSRPPVPPQAFATKLIRHFKELGLHPFQPPLAIDPQYTCDGCQGYICRRPCRKTAENSFLKIALENPNTAIICSTSAERLESNASRANGVHCVSQGESYFFSASYIFCAGGSVHTPLLLLRSKSPDAPNGIGNQFANVGRYLTHKIHELYLIFSFKKPGKAKGPKHIYLSDFCLTEQGKLGIIQDFGSPPAPASILDGEIRKLTSSFNPIKRILGRILRFTQRPLLRILDFLSPYVYLLVTISEDESNRQNHLGLDEKTGQPFIEYEMSKGDLEKSIRLKQKMKSILSPFWSICLNKAKDHKMFVSNSLGTCRMGTDPLTSVVSPEGLVHGMENLYIVDGSTFPSSPPHNTGLTIAANALRMGERFLSKKQDQVTTKMSE